MRQVAFRKAKYSSRAPSGDTYAGNRTNSYSACPPLLWSAPAALRGSGFRQLNRSRGTTPAGGNSCRAAPGHPTPARENHSPSSAAARSSDYERCPVVTRECAPRLASALSRNHSNHGLLSPFRRRCGHGSKARFAAKARDRALAGTHRGCPCRSVWLPIGWTSALSFRNTALRQNVRFYRTMSGFPLDR